MKRNILAVFLLTLPLMLWSQDVSSLIDLGDPVKTIKALQARVEVLGVDQKELDIGLVTFLGRWWRDGVQNLRRISRLILRLRTI